VSVTDPLPVCERGYGIRQIQRLACGARPLARHGSRAPAPLALDALAAKRPAGHLPDEIVAMLNAVPDIRPTSERATDEELAEILKAFDVRITYDKNRQALDLATTITSELISTPRRRSRWLDLTPMGPSSAGLQSSALC
jgi:hypothetical protein